MSITVVDHAATGSNSSGTVNLSGLDSTGGSLLVAIVSCGGFDTPGISDNKSNTWVQIGTISDGSFVAAVTMFYVKNPTVGSGHTFTGTGTGTKVSICGMVFGSTLTTSNVDGHKESAGGLVTSAQPGSITPSKNGCVFVTGCTFISTDTGVAIDSGFTKLDYSNDGNSCALWSAYKIQTGAAAAENPAWSCVQSDTKDMVFAAFQPVPQIFVARSLVSQAVNRAASY